MSKENRLSDKERLDYIKVNEYELTQLAIQNKTKRGPGALYLELDDKDALEKHQIRAMYFTAPFLQTNSQFADIVKVITAPQANSSVHFVYNDASNKSVILEKVLT